MKKKFKFIDLFSGIGGFHQAMRVLGGECVFSSEIDPFAIQTYEENYKINPQNDITKIKASDIPAHDVLCAGFPCQAFSKAGSQLGFEDKIKGTLFFDIVRILKTHKTPYIILENVRNLVSHDKGRTWETIKESLIQLGYVITENPIIISPHHIGIPQHRERVLILGIHKSVGIKQLDINFQKINKNDIDIFESNILERSNELEEYFISEYEEMVLNCWNEFIKGISFIPVKKPKSNNYIKKEFNGTMGFPIWVNEFNNDEADINGIPKWKKEIILKNRSLYINNKEFIDKWLNKWNYLKNFSNTEKKMEWQCGNSCKEIWDGIIQFRPSGIRVKSPNIFPALVAMVQIPIIGKLKRRLTPREAARLQSFPDDFKIHENKYQAYKQFGNAVNINVISFIAEQLFQQKQKKNSDK